MTRADTSSATGPDDRGWIHGLMPWLPVYSLLGRLGLLLAAVVLPLTALVVLEAYRGYRSATRTAQEEIGRVAEGVATLAGLQPASVSRSAISTADRFGRSLLDPRTCVQTLAMTTV